MKMVCVLWYNQMKDRLENYTWHREVWNERMCSSLACLSFGYIYHGKQTIFINHI